MQVILALLFAAHGFAHLVGFVVPWRIANMEEMPYKTTLLNGRLNLGDAGIRIFGLFWLLLSISFFSIAVAVLFHSIWWQSASLYVALVSLLFCLLSWPDARIGLVVNLLIIILLPWAIKSGYFTS